MNSRNVITILASIAVVGCTSMQPLNRPAAELASELKVGERVLVHEHSGRVVDMKYTGSNDHEISGQLSSGGDAVTIDIADIKSVEAERVDKVKMTLGIVVTAVAVTLLVAAAEFAAIDDTFGSIP